MAEDLTPAPEPAEDETVVTAVGAAVTDGAYTLFVADFDDTETAWQAYEALKSVEDGATVAIDGVVVVKRELDGRVEVQKATDHSTRKGLTWGLVGGAVLGIIFPPSIIGSAAALGVVGAAGGKVREVHNRNKLADELDASVIPGHSAIVALVSDPGAVEIRKALAAANAIVESTVDRVVARDVKAAARAAEGMPADDAAGDAGDDAAPAAPAVDAAPDAGAVDSAPTERG